MNRFVINFPSFKVSKRFLHDLPVQRKSLHVPFSSRVQQLIAFQAVNSRLPTGKSDDEKEKSLKAWLTRQVQLRNSGQLSENNQKILESIPGFAWPIPRPSFQQQVLNVVKFIEIHGEFPRFNTLESRSVTVEYKSKGSSRVDKRVISEKTLNKFLYYARHLKVKQKLPPERILMLEALPNFSWAINHENEFEDSVELVKLFVQQYRNLPAIFGTRELTVIHSKPIVPGAAATATATAASTGTTIVSELRLWNFIHRMRVQRAKEILPQQKIELMESIPGFEWSVTFTEKLQQLRAFVERYDRLPKAFPKRYDSRAFKINTINTNNNNINNNNFNNNDDVDDDDDDDDDDGDEDEEDDETDETDEDEDDNDEENGNISNGNSNSPTRPFNKIKEHSLALFVRYMKQCKANNALSKQKIAAMETVPYFEWKGGKQSEESKKPIRSFAENCADLADFVKTYDRMPLFRKKMRINSSEIIYDSASSNNGNSSNSSGNIGSIKTTLLVDVKRENHLYGFMSLARSLHRRKQLAPDRYVALSTAIPKFVW